jgi:hypothetical protein
MSRSELAWRSLHDLGLASWFGGSVFGSVALPHPDPADDSDRVARGSTVAQARQSVLADSWRRWTPVVGGSMAVHLLGGAGLVLWNRGRHRHQKGVVLATTAKTALTAAAVALTVGSAIEGVLAERRRDLIETGDADGDALESQHSAEKRMRVVGTLIPVTTGALLVLGALESEQQRPREILRGVVAGALDDLTPG